MTTIRPLHDGIVIAPAPAVERVGRIILPEIARVRPAIGRVVAAGRGRRTRTGARIPLVVAPGDVVMFSAAGASTVTVGNEHFVIVRERDVLAVDADDAPEAPPIQPLADIAEDDEALEVAVELAGVHPGSIRVALTGSTLTVEAVRRPLQALTPGVYLMRERRVGPLMRTIELPRPVAAAGARASYEAGVLRLRIPKAAAGRTRHIAVLREGCARRSDDPA